MWGRGSVVEAQKLCLFVQPLVTVSSSCCSHSTTFIPEKEKMHNAHKAPLDSCSVAFRYARSALM